MRRHAGRDLAYVYANGQQVYLGPWDSPEARRAYREFIGRWEAGQTPGVPRAASAGLTVAELVAEFMECRAVSPQLPPNRRRPTFAAAF